MSASERTKGRAEGGEAGEGAGAGTVVCLGGNKGSLAFVLNAWKLLEGFIWEKISDFCFQMPNQAALWRMD